MKTLSIKQPWAYLIAAGIKDIENRTWQTKFRGKILIHASAKYIDSKGLFSIEKANEIPYDLLKKIEKNNLVTSAIIGEVDIIDCVINHPSIWAKKSKQIEDVIGNIVHEFITYNWILKNPVLYDEPILGVKGKLSFWEFEKK